MQIPFFAELEKSRRILLSGCGGGFDVYAGIPILVWARSKGIDVVLGNMSFSKLPQLCTRPVGPTGWMVDRSSAHADYFPERHLVDWLDQEGFDPFVVGILSRKGVVPTRETYKAIIEAYGIDTVVLVDGGTDSLLKGDEPDLATFAEDSVSILSVDGLDVERSFLACLGFGIDAYHGISHHSFLENTAEMIRDGAFTGSVAVTKEMQEGRAYLRAVDFVSDRQPDRLSIVNRSVAAAMRGSFGDVRMVDAGRTVDGELFVNPLMLSYWTYDLERVADAMGYGDAIRDTEKVMEVVETVRSYRAERVLRLRKPIPL